MIRRPFRDVPALPLEALVVILLALGGAFPALVSAQSEDPGERDRTDRAIRESGIFGTDEDFTYSYDFQSLDVAQDGSALSFLLLGNVVLEGRGFSLHADGVGFFVDGFDDEGKPRNARVFAEGNILLTRENQSFRAETLFIDVERQSAVLTDTRLRIDQAFVERLRRTPIRDPRRVQEILAAFAPGPDYRRLPGQEAPLVFAAELLTVEDFERVRGEGISVTTCEFGHPHWAVEADEGEAEERQEKDKFPGEDDPGGWLFELDDISLRVGPVPVPLLPGVIWDSRWGRYVPLRSVSYSASGKYGNRVDTLWNGNLLLPSALSREMDLGIRLDYLEKRGTGYGADLEWGRDPLRWSVDPDGRVELFGVGEWYGIEDRGIDRTTGVPPDRSHRYRSRWHQRLRLQTGTYIDAEYATESDDNFLNEYYQDETRTEKAPENLIYLRQPVTGASQITILYQKQGVDYRSTLESLPDMRAYWIEDSVSDAGIIIDAEGSISKLEDRPADDLGLPDRENQRGDVRARAARPVRLVRGVRFRPFVEGRFTYWDENLNGDEEERYVWSGGGTVSTRVWRNFPTVIPALGIRGLRHVIDLDLTYANTFDVSVDPSELIVLDEVERIREREAVRIGLFQRLFTQRRRLGREADRGYSVRSLVDCRFEIEYFPDPERDNDGDLWGPLEGELLLNPVERLGVFVDGSADVHDGNLDEFNAGLRWYDLRALVLQVSTRQRRHQQDTLVVGGRWWGSEKYEFGAFTEFDQRRERAVNQRYSVVRNFHRWSAAFSLEFDEGEDDTTFRLDFGPRDLLGWSQGEEETR